MDADRDEGLLKTITKAPSMGYTDNISKRQMWKEIAGEMNGSFRVSHTAGHDLEIHNITLPYKKHEIRISVSDSRPLKFEIQFTSSVDFRMFIGRTDLAERIISKFIKPKFEIGWKEFDRRYSIRTNRTDLLRRALSRKIQESLLKYDVFSVSYQTDTDKRISEMLSVVQRRAGSKEHMLGLIEMHKLLIDNFEESSIVK